MPQAKIQKRQSDSRRLEHANAYPTAKVIFGLDNRCINQCDWDKCAANPCRQMANISVGDLQGLVDMKLNT
jgi:hypothetical protein